MTKKKVRVSPADATRARLAALIVELKGHDVTPETGVCEEVAREYAELEYGVRLRSPQANESRIRLVLGSSPHYERHVWVINDDGCHVDPKALLDKVDTSTHEYTVEKEFRRDEWSPQLDQIGSD